MYLAQCMTPSWAVSLVAKSCLTLETPWTIACWAPLSMGFPRLEYWSGLPLPSPGDLPDPGIKPSLLHCRQSLGLQADSFEPPGKPLNLCLSALMFFRFSDGKVMGHFYII